MSSTPVHSLRAPEVYRALDTPTGGLTDEEAAARLALYGPNALREPPGVPAWRRFAGQAAHRMALILWVAGGLAFLGGQPALGIVIWVIVLVNAGFSFWQEHRAERAAASLKDLLPPYARVLRGGTETRLLASELVPGDVLVMAEGDHVAADARVVEEFGLRVNTAALTGEAVPARKTADASLREGITELERPNLVFLGTSVVSGTGRAVVFATGMLTQFGRIANLTQAVPDPPSLLQQGMARLTRTISLAALGLGAVVFAVGRFEVGIPDFEAFVLAVGVIVAMVPEGLLPTVTLVLAMAVQRLAGHGVLVKRLAEVETLGMVSVICTDKSGTLTQNQMTVREAWAGGRRFHVSGTGYDPRGEFLPAPDGTPEAGDLSVLLAASMLCNNARLTPPSPESPRWSCLGDSTEAALHVAALKGGLDDERLRHGYPRIHELPFDARRKRMSTVHRKVEVGSWALEVGPAPSSRGGNLQTPASSVQPPTSDLILFTKGAPKEVLQLCTHYLHHGEPRPLDEPARAEILAANDEYARRALRVLAVARREWAGPRPRAGFTPENVERELTFLGLLAMMDPPRPEVAEAMRTIRQAGIRVVMITGDYGLTAESLARRVGMLAGPRARIVTGADVDAMSDAELQPLLGEEVLFARMAPEHKLRLVAAFQARGETVAVVGDGVNDAPALRKADVGIAMGVSGTDVAKEAADVVLTDDNVADVVHAVAEGRAVYDNLRKFVTYIFASNIPEILPFVLSALFRIPLALTVAQILAIDLGTDLLPALALGTEPPEPDLMRRPPRQRAQPLLDRGLLIRAFAWLGGLEAALCYAGFFAVYALAGYADWLNLPRVDLLPMAERMATEEGRTYVLATTVFYAGVVAAQVGNAFACRTETVRLRRLGWFSNRFLLAGILVEILILLATVYIPPLARVFSHLPIPPAYWIGLGLYPVALYGAEKIRKMLTSPPYPLS